MGNSAWNHRFFILETTTNWEIQIFEREIEFVLKKIISVPHNESSWNFLRSLYNRLDVGIVLQRIHEFLQIILRENKKCKFAVVSTIEILKKIGNNTNLKKINKLYKRLFKRIDNINYRYWWFMHSELEHGKKTS